MAAPICAVSLAKPSRSSRAIREARRLVGTATEGEGVAAIVASAAPSPLRAVRSNERFSNFGRLIVSPPSWPMWNGSRTALTQGITPNRMALPAP